MIIHIKTQYMYMRQQPNIHRLAVSSSPHRIASNIIFTLNLPFEFFNTDWSGGCPVPVDCCAPVEGFVSMLVLFEISGPSNGGGGDFGKGGGSSSLSLNATASRRAAAS